MSTQLAFDVFRLEKRGVSWLGSASSLEDAHQKIATQAEYESFRYTIINTQTGHRIEIGFDDGAADFTD